MQHVLHTVPGAHGRSWKAMSEFVLALARYEGPHIKSLTFRQDEVIVELRAPVSEADLRALDGLWKEFADGR